MNEQLTNRVLDWISQTAQQIGDFAAKEVPPFITEYLTWKFWEASISAVGGLAISLTCAIILGIMWKKFIAWWVPATNKDQDAGPVIIVPILISLVLSIPLFGCFPKQDIKDMIQIKIAPKVYLVEKAAELYKQAK